MSSKRRDTGLNPFRVARALDAALVPGARPQFGNFGVFKTQADMLASRPELLPDVEFTDSDDEVIRKTFEKSRDGYAVDRFLADPSRAKRFTALCRKLGVKKPPAALNRRLLALRKRSGGGAFEPTSRRAPHPGLVEKYGAAVEMAMTKLRIRHAVSVDDILADVDVGERFEQLAAAIIPGGSPVEYRLCALQIRKSRHLEPAELELFEQIDTSHVLERLASKHRGGGIAEAPGVVLLSESERPLYLMKTDDMRGSAAALRKAPVAEVLSADSSFWKPDGRSVRVRPIPADELGEQPLRIWELRLINELNPAFNWPVRSRAA